MSSPTPRNTQRHEERYRIAYDFASTAATATVKIDAIETGGRSRRISRCWLTLPAGQAANASNFVNFQLIKGASTVIASWSTSTGVAGQGTITANTPVEMVLTATVANTYLADGDILSFVESVTGTITVPAGRIVASGFEL